MSWTEVSPDGKHRVFRCSECKRFGVTGGTVGKAPGPEVLGRCVCRGPAPKEK